MKEKSSIVAIVLLMAGCRAEQDQDTASPFQRYCEELPRPENSRFPLSEASDDWFQVYEVSDGVYSILEPYQYQQTISHLIVGQERALLFDTGLGLVPIRPVVERITNLPISVVNSHTHYDHVGGNSEFSSVLAIRSDYTRANMEGFAHERIAEDLRPERFCIGRIPDVDLSSFRTPPWTASRYVDDGERLELGGRTLQVLHVPGHTPDATALLDAENGLLFTGDSYYDAELWLFVPETNLDDYERSISRLAGVESNARYLLGAHNSVSVDAGRLRRVEAAFRELRSGDRTGDELSGGRLVFRIDDIEFVTARPVLDGVQGDIANGGSGLDTWP